MKYILLLFRYLLKFKLRILLTILLIDYSANNIITYHKIKIKKTMKINKIRSKLYEE